MTLKKLADLIQMLLQARTADTAITCSCEFIKRNPSKLSVQNQPESRSHVICSDALGYASISRRTTTQRAFVCPIKISTPFKQLT